MHRLLLKLPDAEFDYIKSNAAKMNIPMSTFVRLAIMGQLKSPEIEKPEKEKPLTEKTDPEYRAYTDRFYSSFTHDWERKRNEALEYAAWLDPAIRARSEARIAAREQAKLGPKRAVDPDMQKMLDAADAFIAKEEPK